MNRQATICIFAKPPCAGEVKTRLAAALGPTDAAAVAQALLEDTITIARQVRNARVVLSVTRPFHFMPFPDVPQWLQPEGDLGFRIEAALTRALLDSRCAIALGADTPGLPSQVIEAAIQRLDDFDAAIGPTNDGGYYLLGLKRFPAGLLAGIRWSETDTLADTIHQLKCFGFSYALTESWFDLDTIDDLMRVRSLLETSRISAPQLSLAIRRCWPAKYVAP
jgi:uncharacterized protein